MNRLAALLCFAVLFLLTVPGVPQTVPADPQSAPASAGTTPGDAAVPDDHALSGAVRQGVGSWGARHSFYVPGFRVASTVDSNPILGGLDATGVHGYANLDAELQLVHFWSRDTELRYTGAVRYDSLPQSGVERRFTNAHSGSLAHRWQRRRWMLMMDDQADYSLTSNFAGAGLEGLGDFITDNGQWGALPDIQLASNLLQQQYLPNQSVLTTRSGRISNTALAEFDGRLSAHSLLTLTGDYGLLHFRSPGLIDTDQVALSAGYEYQPTARDTLAVRYVYGRFGFSGADYHVQEDALELRYSRRITGRLSVGGGAGPQYSMQSSGAGDRTALSWQADGSVQYRRGRLALDASVARMLSNGAGVLYGAQTVNFTGGGSYQWSRNWTTSLSGGVSTNDSLVSSQSFGTQFANVTVTHRVGRFASFFLTYYVAHQSAEQSCNGGPCGLIGTRQVGGIGLRWSYRAVPMNF